MLNWKMRKKSKTELLLLYKNESVRPLTNYQRRINEVAQEICLRSPSMLCNRQKLLEMARTKVDETYQFKKGKSRSKRYNPTLPPPKRKKITQDIRLAKMKTLEDDLKNIKERTSYKEKRCRVAEDLKNYRLCDEITEEIGTLSRECRQLEAELKLLKDRKSAHSESSPQTSSRSDAYSTPLDSSESADESEEESPSHGTESQSDRSHDTVILTEEDRDVNF